MPSVFVYLNVVLWRHTTRDLMAYYCTYSILPIIEYLQLKIL